VSKLHYLYFKKTGLIVLSPEKAPLLNLMIPVPFVVVPSAKIKNGEYYAVCSISSYLSFMASRAFYNLSGDPPLGM
jgi:hypothetical protein